MFAFDKQQRLCSYKRITTLFKNGKSFLVWPLSVRYKIIQGTGNVSVLIVCPKRYQKLAVSRNRIKRLLRENYRLNSQDIKVLAKEKKIDMDFSISFVSKEMVDCSFIRMKMLIVLKQLQEEIANV